MRSDVPSPAALGLPARFASWRPDQWDAACRAADAGRRFVALAMPTGSGKSLAYVAGAVLGGGRTCVLTSTKGLQGQLLGDFAPVGLTDIRGMNNYQCLALQDGSLFQLENVSGTHQLDGISCDEGPCHAGFKCDLREAGCLYYDAQRRARGAELAVTNYSYWMKVHSRLEPESKPPLGKFDVLVLDEAHEALEELGSHLAVELGSWEVEGLLGEDWPDCRSFTDWREWAGTMAARASARHDELAAEMKMGIVGRKALGEMRALRDLGRKLAALASGSGEWVDEESRDRRGRRVLRFDPVWPGEYAERALFLGTPRVVLTSATIRPKTLELLGIPPEQSDFREYDSTFPKERRPLVWVPTVRVSYRSTPDQMRLWASKIGGIVVQRPRHKGIIHTVSYARREFLIKYFEPAGAYRVFVPDTADIARAVNEFKQCRPPAVLISPAVGTGFDFPYAACDYQVIGKVPFPDSKSRVVQARMERDPDYSAYVAMQNLVQMCGRGMRAADDWCQNIIVDDNVQWFMRKYRAFAPKWFLESYVTSNTIPEPLK